MRFESFCLKYEFWNIIKNVAIKINNVFRLFCWLRIPPPLPWLFSTVFAIELWNFHKLSDSGKNEFLPKKIGDSVTNFHSIANFTGLPGLYATAISSYSFWATWLKLHIYVPRHTVKIFYWGFFDILPVSIFIPN